MSLLFFDWTSCDLLPRKIWIPRFLGAKPGLCSGLRWALPGACHIWLSLGNLEVTDSKVVDGNDRHFINTGRLLLDGSNSTLIVSMYLDKPNPGNITIALKICSGSWAAGVFQLMIINSLLSEFFNETLRLFMWMVTVGIKRRYYLSTLPPWIK